MDKVDGLKLGADDYAAKPFGLHELLAREEALVRRFRMCVRPAPGSDQVDTTPVVFHLGAVEIVCHSRSVRRPDGTETHLTARELKLAEVLASRSGEVLIRDELLESVWGQA